MMVHSGFMPKPTKDITGILKRERLELFEKSNSVVLKMIAKHRKLLDASPNSLRVVEQPVGGEVVEKKRR